jgi:hypothetical protein
MGGLVCVKILKLLRHNNVTCRQTQTNLPNGHYHAAGEPLVFHGVKEGA